MLDIEDSVGVAGAVAADDNEFAATHLVEIDRAVEGQLAQAHQSGGHLIDRDVRVRVVFCKIDDADAVDDPALVEGINPFASGPVCRLGGAMKLFEKDGLLRKIGGKPVFRVKVFLPSLGCGGPRSRK